MHGTLRITQLEQAGVPADIRPVILNDLGNATIASAQSVPTEGGLVYRVTYYGPDGIPQQATYSGTGQRIVVPDRAAGDARLAGDDFGPGAGQQEGGMQPGGQQGQQGMQPGGQPGMQPGGQPGTQPGGQPGGGFPRDPGTGAGTPGTGAGGAGTGTGAPGTGAGGAGTGAGGAGTGAGGAGTGGAGGAGGGGGR